MEAKEQANLEEDLAVMSHILDKALNEKGGWRQPATTAMGVNVYFSPSSTPLRSLYLEGYGALFLLNFVSAVPIALGLAAPLRRLAGRWTDALRALLALSGLGVAAGSLAGLLISESSGLFGFMEDGYSTPIVIACTPWR